MEKIEVEIRGPLNKEEYSRLLNFLQEKAEFLEERSQSAIFFANEAFDLSLKKSNKSERITLKLGDWHSPSREEIEVFLKTGDFDKALNIFKKIGFDKGYKNSYFRKDFKYGEIEVALKNGDVIGDHFEMEMTADNMQQASVLREKLVALAKELNLRVWEPREYREHVIKSHPSKPTQL